MKKMPIDINADIGEGFGQYTVGCDRDIMSYVSSVNIACGFHGGDYLIMDRTVKKAIENQVEIGAHPGYPDRYGFGRRPMIYSHEEIRAQLIYQISALKGMVACRGGHLHHVKLHGALYNAAAKDEALALLVAKTVQTIDDTLILYGLSGSSMIRTAKSIGLKTKEEVFADRRYMDTGQLLPRTKEGSVLESKKDVLNQVKMIVKKGQVVTESGALIALSGETICVHGDTVASLDLAKSIYEFVNQGKE